MRFPDPGVAVGVGVSQGVAVTVAIGDAAAVGDLPCSAIASAVASGDPGGVGVATSVTVSVNTDRVGFASTAASPLEPKFTTANPTTVASITTITTTSIRSRPVILIKRFLIWSPIRMSHRIRVLHSSLAIGPG
jgi:hypothetical protein